MFEDTNKLKKVFHFCNVHFVLQSMFEVLTTRLSIVLWFYSAYVSKLLRP